MKFISLLVASTSAYHAVDALWDEICLHIRSDTLRNWHESVDHSLWTLFGESGVSQTLYYYNNDAKNEDYTVCGRFPEGEKIKKISYANMGSDGFAIQYLYLTYPDGFQQWFVGMTKSGQYVFRIAVDGDDDLDQSIKEFSTFCQNGKMCNLWPAEYLTDDRSNDMQIQEHQD